MLAIDPKALRRAFGSYMTGVTVVTARADDGTPVGFTANSFTSVSLDPPLLLVCPGNHLSSYDVFRACRHFAVNILAEGQEDISNVFASSKGARFDAVNWTDDKNGVPIIAGVTASFSCTAHSQFEAGDHCILIGQVAEFSASDRPGLGYGQGGYFSLAKERLAQSGPSQDRPTIVGAIIEQDGGLFAPEQNGVRCLPTVTLPANTGARTAIERYLADQNMPAQIGRVYSVFDDPKRDEKFIFFTAKLAKPAIADRAEFLPVDDIAQANWPSTAVTSMMARYHRESANRQFGLYIGDADAGEIHPENTA